MTKTAVLIALVATAVVNDKGERIVIAPGQPLPPVSGTDRAALLAGRAARETEAAPSAPTESAAAPVADAAPNRPKPKRA